MASAIRLDVATVIILQTPVDCAGILPSVAQNTKTTGYNSLRSVEF